MTEKKQRTVKSSKADFSPQLLQQADSKIRRVDIFLFFLLLSFGIYHAVIYWGHQVVPHFDFNCFAVIGHDLLSFQMPRTFKRVPLVGILQVLLGHIAGGAYPDLNGGWLLNSIVHPLTAVFLWLAGRKVIGRRAIWFAVIAIINPWGLQLLTEAIAETPLLFFIWITLFFIFKRSKWAYFFASLTSIARYEGAALILGAFVLDMIESKNNKQRVMAFIYSAIASIPLAIWMLGTFLTWEGEGATHYLKIFSKEYTSQFAGGVKSRIGFMKHAKILWQVGFYSLLLPSPEASQSFSQILANISKISVVVSFLFGSVYGLYKRKWEILVLLIFLLPYFWIHSKYPYPVDRYHATIFAIVMLICVYGLYGFWGLISSRLPRGVIIVSQIAVIIAAFIWTLTLWGYLPQVAAMSKASVSLPYAAILVIFIVLAAGRFAYKEKLLTGFVILSLMILIIVSNQFVVAGIVGNGERDIEFKYLVDWYKANAKKGEKLVTTVPLILQIMDPADEDYFIHTDTFDANNPSDFVIECYKRNIKYVAWDSRVGLVPSDHYYKYWKMSNIAPLVAGRDVGPYQFITQLRVNQRRYINLYRLRYPPPGN
jgi:hypothetical protein